MNEDEILELNYKTPIRNTCSIGCECFNCRLALSFEKTKKRLNERKKKLLEGRPKSNGKITITIPRISIPPIVFGRNLGENI